jgi:hypothetical protein
MMCCSIGRVVFSSFALAGDQTQDLCVYFNSFSLTLLFSLLVGYPTLNDQG